MMIRQGDVLLIPVVQQDINSEYVEMERNRGRVILAYGEATGHAHAIYEPQVKLYQNKKSGKRVLRVEGNVCYLKHEEHSQHEIPAGDYLVIQQQEYTPEEIRRVTD